MASPDATPYFSGASSRRRSGADEVDDEEALQWAAMERLPSFERLRTGLMLAAADASPDGCTGSGRRRRFAHEEVDVRAMGLAQRQAFVDRVFRVAEEDNERFLKKLRARIDRAGIQIPTVEVRFRDLNVEAECHVGTRALPTLANVSLDVAEGLLGRVGVRLGKRRTLHILKGVSGVVRPSRMTLLLGPPSSGKTTLLLALAGKLDPTLEVGNEVFSIDRSFCTCMLATKPTDREHRLVSIVRLWAYVLTARAGERGGDLQRVRAGRVRAAEDGGVHQPERRPRRRDDRQGGARLLREVPGCGPEIR